MKKELLELFFKQTIVFESIPPFTDNTTAVYDELVRRGYHKKYNFVWYSSYSEALSVKNGRIVKWNPRDRKTLLRKIRNYRYYDMVKCVVCCNSFLTTDGDKSIFGGKGIKRFYLSHGSPMKSVKEYYRAPDTIDYALAPSEAMKKIMSEELSIDINKFFVAGYPRNDEFAKPPIDLRGRIGTDCKKIIIWYPTYRQNDTGSIVTTRNALPIIHDERNALVLNEAARKNDTLIILKPHFRQDVSRIKKLDLSNILFIGDDFFSEHGFTSYQMLSASDALISDYASVYFDYTLADKPVGVIWEDIAEYRKFPGFALDIDFYLKGAEKIYTLEELCAFVADVAAGKDRLKTERREIRDLANISADGRNAARTADFIIDKAKL